MKITKLEKKKRLYLLELDNDQKLYITEDTIVKYFLSKDKEISEEELKEIEDRSKATIDDAVEFAKESPFADGSIAFQDNYAD